MTEQEALARMIPPSQHRPGKLGRFGGVIQIWVTRACDKSCFGCTQGSNFAGKPHSITVDQFEQACISLKDYFGVIGMFGGNPAAHPKFPELCEVMKKYIPHERRGLWCNNPLGHGAVMRATFNPAVCNLNVHLDQAAYDGFKADWPESMPFGLTQDCRHSPPYVAMKDVIPDEGNRWGLIANCDINQHWSAMIGVFRNQVRAWFCEIAGAQAMLHQDDPDYPDTGLNVDYKWKCDRGAYSNHHYTLGMARGEATPEYQEWWQLPMSSFTSQVEKHCHECGVPLRGYGELAQSVDPSSHEQVSVTHATIGRSKRPNRPVEVVTSLEQLGLGRLQRMTDYMGNAKR